MGLPIFEFFHNYKIVFKIFKKTIIYIYLIFSITVCNVISIITDISFV